MYGSIQQGKQQQEAAEYNAAVARTQAQNEANVGKINEALTRDNMRRQMAYQRAHLASGGVSLGSGTSLDLGQDAGATSFLEIQSARTSAQARSDGYEADARLSQLEGRQAAMSGKLNAGAIFLNNMTGFAQAGGIKLKKAA
jgi:hypothetical protein